MAEVVRGTAGRHHFEQDAAGQRLAPEELVIPPECRTVSVRIFVGPPRGVGSEVEGDVDRLAQTHISTVHPARQWSPITPIPPRLDHHNLVCAAAPFHARERCAPTRPIDRRTAAPRGSGCLRRAESDARSGRGPAVSSTTRDCRIRPRMRKPAPLITTYRVGTISEATQLRDLITATTSKRVSGDSLSDLLFATGVQLRVTNTTSLGGNSRRRRRRRRRRLPPATTTRADPNPARASAARPQDSRRRPARDLL